MKRPDFIQEEERDGENEDVFTMHLKKGLDTLDQLFSDAFF